MGFFSLSARKKIFAKLERREVEGTYNLLDPMVYGFLLVTYIFKWVFVFVGSLLVDKVRIF